MRENRDTTYHILRDAAKVVLSGKFIAVIELKKKKNLT